MKKLFTSAIAAASILTVSGVSANTSSSGIQLMPTAKAATAEATPSTSLVNGAGVVRTPDIKVTQHIRRFDVNACKQDLINQKIPPLKAQAACFTLSLSANNEPPNTFTAKSWTAFQTSKEYRGFIHIPSIGITCLAGKITGSTIPNERFSYGYTKVPPGIFSDGDVYKPPYNGYTFRIEGNNSRLIVVSKRASRLSKAERLAQFVLLGYDAPFIYTEVKVTLNCDGNPSIINVARSVFPTTRFYINDSLRDERAQADLGRFIVSGGKTFNDDGFGNLAPAGAGMRW